ncbi:MAG: hypothetical protein AAF991_12920, partial [Pseudomonadota bacterium]
MTIKLIVGLGNPGAKYEGTRHNAGEDFVRELARQWGVSLKTEAKFFGETAEALVGRHKLRLLIPHTFMNLSGKAVAALARGYEGRLIRRIGQAQAKVIGVFRAGTEGGRIKPIDKKSD